MMNEQEAQEIEVTTEKLKYDVEMGECFARLRSNPDYIKLFENNYLTDNASRLVKLRGEGEVSPGFQEKILNEIDAVGALAVWLRTVHTRHGLAELRLKEIEDFVSEEEALSPNSTLPDLD